MFSATTAKQSAKPKNHTNKVTTTGNINQSPSDKKALLTQKQKNKFASIAITIDTPIKILAITLTTPIIYK